MDLGVIVLLQDFEDGPMARVHFLGFPFTDDEWYPVESDRLAPVSDGILRSYVVPHFIMQPPFTFPIDHSVTVINTGHTGFSMWLTEQRPHVSIARDSHFSVMELQVRLNLRVLHTQNPNMNRHNMLTLRF